jgi:hypothetical protein
MSEPIRLPLDVAKESLFRRMQQENILQPDFQTILDLDLTSVLALVVNLQIALRHPSNTGASAKIMRELLRKLIEGMRDRGFVAHAEACELGSDPAWDE